MTMGKFPTPSHFQGESQGTVRMPVSDANPYLRETYSFIIYNGDILARANNADQRLLDEKGGSRNPGRGRLGLRAFKA